MVYFVEPGKTEKIVKNALSAYVKNKIKGRKPELARFFDQVGILKILDFLRGNNLIILNYHRVYRGELATAFDEELFGPSLESFTQQMRWLKENRAVFLSEDELIYFQQKQKKIPKRSVLITFDDGYKDNFTLVYPVLRSLHIPAIYFIPAEAIMDRKLGWWDIISFFIKNTRKKTISITGREFSLLNDREKKDAILHLLQLMKTEPHSRTQDLLNVLSKECEVGFPSYDEQDAELMTRKEIEEVQNNGIAIGSHTVSHRVLATLDENEQFEELCSSKRLLEDMLPGKIRSFSYPVGDYTAFTKKTKDLAKKAGYDISFSFKTGVNHQRITDPFDIKRIEPPSDFHSFRATIIAPRIFSIRSELY
ncbi:MAG: polysaccharide deacetylase [Candidatus Electrothrix sp. AR5]|nr:polysaccharide deacetylase [Candidatus Electrothrix sp. AR5]